MKKIFIAVFLSTALLAGTASAGEIFDAYTLIITEKQQREDIISFKSALVRATKSINLELANMAAIKATGSFETIPADLKTFFLQWENLFKDVKTTYDANATVQEFLSGGEAP